MNPRIKEIKEKRLVGMSMEMSLLENSTYKLFNAFMPKRREIRNALGNGIFDLKEYREDYFSAFDPAAKFMKWAAVEVREFKDIPNDMKPFLLPSGKYAVFLNKGSDTDNSVFEFIFRDWLPKSAYNLDNRAHFDIIKENVLKNDSSTDGEIWVPIKHKDKS